MTLCRASETPRSFSSAAIPLATSALRDVTSRAASASNPTRRRHAFKVATVWLLGVATLFAVGATTVGLILGGMLIAACAAVTIFNLCLPSVTLALIDRYRRRGEPMPA